MTRDYTREQKALFVKIRADILGRPDLYGRAVEFLRGYCSPDAHHRRQMEAWKQFSDSPVQLDSHRLAAEWEAQREVPPEVEHDEPDKRDRVRREVFWQMSRAPSPSPLWMMQSLGDLVRVHLSCGLDGADALTPVDLTAAASVLFLTWLLTDEHADDHEIGKAFGPWGKSKSDGRYMAAIVGIGHGDVTPRWIELCEDAWTAMQSHPRRGDLPAGHPPKAAAAVKKKGGRPRVARGSAAGQQRVNYCSGWRDAKARGTVMKDYCAAAKITAARLRNYQQWERDNPPENLGRKTPVKPD